MPIPAAIAKEINDYLSHYILVADGKAVAVAAGGLALLGLVASQAEVVPKEWPTLVGTAFAATSVVLSCAVLYPRTPHGSAGHIFWADIRRFQTAEEYWRSLSSLEADDVGREYSRQNYFISSVLISKNAILRAAIAFAALSAIVLAGAILTS